MNTPEWIEYTGSDEQNRDILGIKTDVLFRYSNGVHRLRSSMFTGDWKHRTLTQYLICQPHPYADLIKIWADTGCPVWVRPQKPYEFKISDYLNHPTTRLMVDGKGVYLIATVPDWSIPGEYSLTPFED